jgi:hypothetical protein
MVIDETADRTAKSIGRSNPVASRRIADALELAVRARGDQVRSGTKIRCISHLVGVAR